VKNKFIYLNLKILDEDVTSLSLVFVKKKNHYHLCDCSFCDISIHTSIGSP